MCITNSPAMKNPVSFTLRGAVIALIALCAISVSSAGDKKEDKIPDIPKKYDTNQNGKVDPSELAAWRADQAKQKTPDKKKGDPE